MILDSGFYTNHGLYLDNDLVIHYTGFANGWQRGKIEQISLVDFETGKGSTIRKYVNRAFSREQSVERARHRIGEDFYCLMSNNCEHFVAWCITGDHGSFQVRRGASAANVVFTSVGWIGAIVGVAEAGIVTGLSGPGIMSGLATIGSVVGGGAVTGVGVAATLPTVASVFVMKLDSRTIPAFPPTSGMRGASDESRRALELSVALRVESWP